MSLVNGKTHFMKNYLLEMAQSIYIYHRKIQALATELFKVKYGLSPEIASENFTCNTECQYNLRLEAVGRRCSVKTVFLEILQISQENICARVFF